MKKIELTDAVGQLLGHDITGIDAIKKTKYRAFKRGHVIKEEDLNPLKDLGKNQVFIMAGDEVEIHEDEAALTIAPLVAGENITFDFEPKEGKISFYASINGLFKVDVDRLFKINSLEIPSLPTLHTNFPVKKNKQVAAFRIIPLSCQSSVIDKIKTILKTPLIHIKPFLFKKAGIIVTGNEIYDGRIKDAFIPRIGTILKHYNVEVTKECILPDKKEKICEAILEFEEDCDIIFVTGGTSVDPDDQTVAALMEAGVTFENKGNPIQPGNNFTVGSTASTVVCAVPAAAIYYKATALDVFLPRMLAGEKIQKDEIFQSGHGGLCHFCEKCHFPICPFAVSH